MTEKEVLELREKIQKFLAGLGHVWTDEYVRRKNGGKVDYIELKMMLKVTK